MKNAELKIQYKSLLTKSDSVTFSAETLPQNCGDISAGQNPFRKIAGTFPPGKILPAKLRGHFRRAKSFPQNCGGISAENFAFRKIAGAFPPD